MSYKDNTVSQSRVPSGTHGAVGADPDILYMGIDDVKRRSDDPRFLSSDQLACAAAEFRETGPPILTVCKTTHAVEGGPSFTAIAGAAFLDAIRDAGITHVPVRLVNYTEMDILKVFVSEPINVKMSTLNRALAARGLVAALDEQKDALACVSKACEVGRDQLRNLLTIADIADGHGRDVAENFPTSAAPALRRIKSEGPWTAEDLDNARSSHKRSMARSTITNVFSQDPMAVIEIFDEAARSANNPDLRERLRCMRAAIKCAQSGVGAHDIEQSLADLSGQQAAGLPEPVENRARDDDDREHSQLEHRSGAAAASETLNAKAWEKGSESEHRASHASAVSDANVRFERPQNMAQHGPCRSGASGSATAAEPDAAHETQAHPGSSRRRSWTQCERPKGETFDGPVIDRVKFFEYASGSAFENHDKNRMAKQANVLDRVNELARTLGLCSEDKQYLRLGRLYAHANEHSKRPEKLGSKEIALMLAVCESARPVLSAHCTDRVLVAVVREMQALNLPIPRDMPNHVIEKANR